MSGRLASHGSGSNMAGAERIAMLEKAHKKLGEQFERAQEEGSRKLAEQRDEFEKAKKNESELSQRC